MVNISVTLSIFDTSVPSVFIWQKVLSHCGNHPAKAVVIVVLEILVF